MAQNLFGAEVPTSPDAADGEPYALGTIWSPAVDGHVTHCRWHFPLNAQPGGVQVEAALYRNDTTLLSGAPVQFSATPVLGDWNVVAFAAPIPVVAGETYMIVVWTPNRYVFTAGYPWPKISGDLTSGNPAGRFLQTAAMAFPTSTFGTPSYFPDPVFEPASDDVTGDGELLLPALTTDGTGELLVPGDGVLLLPALTTDGAGLVTADGAGVLLLPALTTAGTGSSGTTGDGTLPLPALDTAGAGSVTLAGDGIVLLPALTTAGTGTVLDPDAPITGSGAIVLPALTTDGTGEIMGACEPWPIDTSCLPAGWPASIDQFDPGQLSAYEAAQETLAGLLPQAFGLCTLIVRPCGFGCAVSGGFRIGDGGWFTPMLRNGQVFNGCGCTSSCGCDVASEIRLDGPVYDVVQVRIDGTVVDPDTYRVDDALRLVRLDGEVWPMRQNLSASAGRPDTFEVAYRRGVPLPVAGRRALTALMIEFRKAACGDTSCQLPSRVTNIVREGVTYSMADDPSTLLDNGRTGVPLVDQWLAVMNPYGTRTRMKVWSPDVPRKRRQTWPSA